MLAEVYYTHFVLNRVWFLGSSGPPDIIWEPCYGKGGDVRSIIDAKNESYGKTGTTIIASDIEPQPGTDAEELDVFKGVSGKIRDLIDQDQDAREVIVANPPYQSLSGSRTQRTDHVIQQFSH